ncbi:MAG: molybdopterin-guanine dinucleotide biosynthesis protein B [Dehalococcoidales bacterium]|nr:molybdopterin-guanine dinucleotide biosynthesis protein B [Dehalococcoidales bacterium]
MAAIVSIVGHSQSGKTTIIEKLIREMVSRGYNIATVKHTHHKVTPDQPEKDSWRHLQAGSSAAVLSSTDNVTLIKPMADAGIDDIAQLLGEDYDLILAEGFKHDNAPKIEVHRKSTGLLLTGITELFAIVSDEPLDSRIRQFGPDDVSGLADLIVKDFIKPQGEQVALYVNDVAIPMKSFIKDIVANVMVGIAVSLKGVGEVKKLRLFLRKRD